MKTTWTKLSKEEKAEAKSLFMQYESIAFISEKFNLPRTTVQYHATQKKNAWDTEREMLKADLFAKFSASKRSTFINMQSDIMVVIQKAISHLAKRDMPPSPREAKDATAMLESLDKITRLDDGKPTEITSEKVMKFEDIEAIANLVPFKSKKKIENDTVEEIVYLEEKNEKND